ncbi:DUF1127 domain-containing protein [Fertoebacter nigrum]|uniref:DUF1127 domain-containing protein n=1 Tax=Fertoeibacter niger TaxID=2656921 RepID=A0A8X8KPG8_9RHOB|nr:DUF1127 domain-containing protein [Fertoeibacter niger]NUB46055.1 DUF1127 domain-containing protein [Fertoeibacter niger]
MFASLHTASLTLRSMPKGGTLARIAATLQLGLIARRQRAHLGRLDDHALADIGLTRADALAEAARPVWDVPASWRC